MNTPDISADFDISAQIVRDIATITNRASSDILSRGGYVALPVATILVGMLSGLLATMTSGNEHSVRELAESMLVTARRHVARIEDTK